MLQNNFQTRLKLDDPLIGCISILGRVGGLAAWPHPRPLSWRRNGCRQERGACVSPSPEVCLSTSGEGAGGWGKTCPETEMHPVDKRAWQLLANWC